MRRFFPVLFLAATACAGSDAKSGPEVVRKNGVQCNPVSLGECLLPIPSSAWQEADDSSATGFRLNLPAALLPVKTNTAGQPVFLDPAPYNAADGWSPATHIFVHSAEPLDAANLPPHEDIAQSLEAASPTVILDAETGERVAHWAELDQNDTPAGAYLNHGLLIRPAGDLKRSHRYIVALTTALKTTTGKPISVSRAYQALRDGRITENALVERLRPRYETIFPLLEAAGLNKNDILLAWDFDTASDAYIHRDILAMRNQAIEALGDTGLGYEISSIEAPNGNHPGTFRVVGTYKSPLFLEDGGNAYVAINRCGNQTFGDCTPSGYVRNASGVPAQAGTWDRPFVMVIPESVTTATEPLKLVQFGHGLLGGGTEIFGGYISGVAKEWNVAFIAGDWTGLSEPDVPIVAAGLLNWNLFAITGYRLGQGHIDALALSFTARQIVKDAALAAALAHADPITPAGMTYYGISLGGIMGGGFMALHPFIKSGVLNVPGSTWSLMMQRSSNWNLYGNALTTGYPNFLHAQILLTISQTLFDISDPIAFAPHILADPFPGAEAKHILYQEAVNDSQVPNVATEKMARAMGLPLITPSVRDVFGLVEVSEAKSALTIWDEDRAEIPLRINTPPTSDNDTHGSIRKLPALKAQIQQFLWGDGNIINTCNGVCDPE